MQPIVTLTMNPALDIATATDRVVPTHKLRCAAPRYDPGGGGINVARAVHALGGDAVAIFPAGGAAGEMIRHLLDEEDVAYDAVAIAGFTRESLAVEERATGNQFRFILPGPEISEEIQEHCLDQLARRASEADYIVASGSLPLGATFFRDEPAALAQAVVIFGHGYVGLHLARSAFGIGSDNSSLSPNSRAPVVVLKVRKVSGVDILSLRHPDMGSLGVRREWTDWAPPGTPGEPTKQSLIIDARGLLRLVDLVSSLKHKN